MKLLSFRRSADSAVEVGILIGDQVGALKSLGYSCMISTIGKGTSGIPANGEGLEMLPLASVKLTAPIVRPPKVICIGLNYRDHAEESNMKIPDRPTVFAKFPHTVIGPGDAVVLPKASTQPDYEAEFAVVIGKPGRYIKKENWKDHVFGYTIVHDVSARDFQLATSQWIMGKTFDTFCPMGPVITTADEIADPHQLDVRLTLNGQVLQDSNTKHLIFDLPTLIEHLSSVFTLESGDIISTGTPAGVGFARKPPIYLKPGDTATIYVQGIGELTNPFVGE
jgi:2-keto-4-pentenoate hydratase/2-oxohepta-3-ene-1,7-dioic acid hydratase in catechol pathway